MNAEMEKVQEPRDYTKFIWIGVAALFLIMVGALVVVGQRQPPNSRVKVKHILISFDKTDPTDRARALELITDLRKRIENGADFGKIAEQYSDDTYSASRGGELNYHQKGDFDGAFEEYVWTAPIGKLSDIITTKFGFHLVVVEDRYISPSDRYKMELEERARENPDLVEGQ